MIPRPARRACHRESRGETLRRRRARGAGSANATLTLRVIGERRTAHRALSRPQFDTYGSTRQLNMAHGSMVDGRRWTVDVIRRCDDVSVVALRLPRSCAAHPIPRRGVVSRGSWVYPDGQGLSCTQVHVYGRRETGASRHERAFVSGSLDLSSVRKNPGARFVWPSSFYVVTLWMGEGAALASGTYACRTPP